MPFWVCDAEKFSGMKKQESKSEAFSVELFKYRFIGVPIADDGVYILRRVWYGFSVNKGSAGFGMGSRSTRAAPLSTTR